MLEIGSPAGTRAHLAPGGTAGADPAELAVALEQPEPPETPAGFEGALEEAESVTARVERAVQLFTLAAQGRVPDRQTLVREADKLLGALERADREGRYADVIRLARALVGLLALLFRWVALAGSLRMALRAAQALGAVRDVAWAQHELGTLSLAADDPATAEARLEEALRLRRQQRSQADAEMTQHNLDVLHQAFGTGRSRWRRPLIATGVAAVALLVAFGALLLLLRDDGQPPELDTTAPVVEITEAPDDPTQERSAVFEFEADEEVRQFECRLDEGEFAECVSPHNVPGPLDFGEHAFRVRAVDFAGNRGEAALHEWTVERGEGPEATIVEAPDPLTNVTLAQFVIEAPDAFRLECRLDDGDFESCPTRPSYEVGEGEHVFVVRALDAEDTRGPPARHRWTVDTTPPTVEIGEVEFTSPTAVQVPFRGSESGSVVECVLLQRFAAEQGQEPPEPEELETVPDCESPAVFDDLEPNILYLVRMAARDAAGNVGDPAEVEFDTVPDIT